MARNFSTNFMKHQGKLADKWSSYLPFYDSFCKDFNPARILEVGVQNGGSLELWTAVFPDAELILGVDIDEKCNSLHFQESNVSILIGDITHEKTQKAIRKVSNYFDLIIDDGSHKSSDIVATIIHLLPALSPGGKFVIEDLHSSYWSDWEGGLFLGDSAMRFLMRLVDVLNHEHWDEIESIEDYLAGFHQITPNFVESLTRVKQISFENSLCLIEMSTTKSKTTLGERLIVGAEIPVTQNALDNREKDSSCLRQVKSELNPNREVHLDPLAIERLIHTNHALQLKLDDMQSSISWRVTRPARELLKFFGK